LQRVPAWQFERWYELYAHEPWGEERSDLAIGTLIMHLCALKGVAPKEPLEYMHFLRQAQPPAECLGDDDVIAAVEKINAALAKK